MGVGIRMGSKGAPLDPIFGTGSLGDLTINANTNLSELQVGGQSVFPSFAEDTGIFELNCRDFILDSEKTLTADKRNAGIIIRCKRNCTISGSIVNRMSPKILSNAEQAIVEAKYPSWMTSGTAGRGGRGGSGGSPGGAGGTAMPGRIYGGGWSSGGGGGGGACLTTRSYYYSGGAGGSTHEIYTTTQDANLFKGGSTFVGGGNPGTNGGGGAGATEGIRHVEAFGGAGATGRGNDGAGGGNKSVGSYSYYNGGGGGAGNYGGGVIIIICKGILTITGTLNCKGQNGGTSGYAVWGVSGGNAGGGGGGRIYLLGGKPYSITGGTFDVTGGSAGTREGFGGEAGIEGTKHIITYSDYKNGLIPTPL